MQSAIEFLPSRVYYVASNSPPAHVHNVHFFTIDENLQYWNFYLDFGPLNLGQTFIFCEMLNKKLSDAESNLEKIVLYSSMKGQFRANAVCLLGCWGILYRNMTPEQAFAPFQHMRFPAFHDATPFDCTFQLTISHCLSGLEKALQQKYISLETFDLKDYQHFERVENGDLTWMSPKFIAFAGPHQQYNRTLQGHVMLPPEHYIPYFQKMNVTLVVRLNDKQYDASRFKSAGIDHLDLIYPDGTNAPIPILLKFIDACEKTSGAVAVHCKAGLGRTGTCIGAYMMKHDLFSAHELIGWLRLCRPGSVIGPQQQYLQYLQPQMWALHPNKSSKSTEQIGNLSSLVKKSEKNVRLAHLQPKLLRPTLNNKLGKNIKSQGDDLNEQKVIRLQLSKILNCNN